MRPSHPEVTGIRDQYMARFARLAIANDDIALARIQQSRIKNLKIRTNVTDEVQEAANRIDRQFRPPPFFTLPRIAFLAILSILFVCLYQANQTLITGLTEDTLHQTKHLAHMVAHKLKDEAPADLPKQDGDQTYPRFLEVAHFFEHLHADYVRIVIFQRKSDGSWIPIREKRNSERSQLDSTLTQADSLMPPGASQETLPPEANSTLEDSIASACFVGNQSRVSSILGFSPLPNGGSTEKDRILAVEVSPRRFDELVATIRVQNRIEVGIIALAVLFGVVARYSRFCSMQRYNDVIRHRSESLATLKDKELNLG